MRSFKASSVFCLTGLVTLSMQAGAALVSSCAADFSSCNVYENSLLTFPSGQLGVSGDVIVRDPNNVTVDVFRIFNDVFDSGGGTGLGDQAFMYALDTNNLPNPSTYSFNDVFIQRSGVGPTGFYETDYNGNGTLYRLFTPSPEPGTLALLSLGALLVGGSLLRKRWRSHFGCSVGTLPDACRMFLTPSCVHAALEQTLQAPEEPKEN